ncbi:MAG: SpoIIE family protein phosphatase [Micrococcales bacterium]|nr:SpoIIE family protein phosphatase [Micrococcales bacterium]
MIERSLVRALRSSGVPMLALDANMRPVWVNEAFTREFGMTLDVLASHRGSLLQHPATRMTDPPAAFAAISEQRENSQVIQIRRADHTWTPVLAWATPVLDGEQLSLWLVRLDTLASASVDLVRNLVGQERRDLQVLADVAQVSTNISSAGDLDATARVLVGSVVRHACFLVDLDSPHTDGGDPDDPALQVLTGGGDGMADLDLSADWPPGSLAHLVATRLRDRAYPEAQPDAPQIFTLLAVPGRHSVVGLLAVVPLSGAGMAELDRATLGLLRVSARRVGTTLESSTLYLRAHRLAETMQRSMLPQQAEIDGLDVWTYYAPNIVDTQIGGDWYDILPVRPGTAGIVIGDVVGHDVEAAATMGQLRAVVRAYTLEGSAPEQVLARLDQIVAGMQVSRAAGIVCSTLTAADDGWQLDYCRAGHLPPLLRRDQSVTYLNEGRGPMIGFGQNASRAGATVGLQPGDVLVYYTDGLVEHRGRNMRDGLDVLARVVRDATGPDAARIGEEMLSRLARHAEDDIAVVVVRVPAESADVPVSHRRRSALPHDPSALRIARQAVRGACDDWDLPSTKSAELVVSELVANAVNHGWGEVTLQLTDVDDALRIEVTDGNPAPPVATDGHPDRIGGFGIKIVEQLADWGWRQTGSGGKVVWAKMRALGDDETY